MIQLRYPNITGKTPEERQNQMERYVRSLVDQLNMSTQKGGTSETAAKETAQGNDLIEMLFMKVSSLLKQVEYLEKRIRKTPVNLLDNSDFTDLVAQAGFLGIHGTALYLADRWSVNSSRISYDSINRVIAFTASNTPLMLTQIVSSNLSGKTITLAIKASSVMGNVNLSENGAESGHADVRITDGITTHTFVGGEQTRVLLWSKEDASLCIDWIALYEGEYTSETLPSYVPKGYAAEQMECMRYYQIAESGFGAANSAGSILYAFFPLTVPMAATPSIAYVDTLHLRGNGILSTTTASSATVKHTEGSSTVEVDIVGTFTDFSNHAATIIGTVHFCADL